MNISELKKLSGIPVSENFSVSTELENTEQYKSGWNAGIHAAIHQWYEGLGSIQNFASELSKLLKR